MPLLHIPAKQIKYKPISRFKNPWVRGCANNMVMFLGFLILLLTTWNIPVSSIWYHFFLVGWFNRHKLNCQWMYCGIYINQRFHATDCLNVSSIYLWNNKEEIEACRPTELKWTSHFILRRLKTGKLLN